MRRNKAKADVRSTTKDAYTQEASILKDKFIYQLYHSKGQNELAHDWCFGPIANQDLSVCYGESGDISRPNDDAVIGQCDLIVERERAYRLVYGAPITNQDFVCLLWGKAEVRVAFQ